MPMDMPEPLKSAMQKFAGCVTFGAAMVIQGVVYPLPLVFHFHHKETPEKARRVADRLGSYLKTVPVQTWN